ncbi:hypothetical protein HHK36_002097 [Tetracentron sinense]|uniref:F-box protein n=1 Tax=Tetracentron sinense TaxID=13715 RepID=A0A834ZZ86_TETSI|nr:hypothetical protein HHK36_002097 [Tetracentron sinense]
MATLRASTLLSSSSSSCCPKRIKATLQVHAPELGTVSISFPKLPTRNMGEELNMRGGCTTTTTTLRERKTITTTRDDADSSAAAVVIAELYEIAEAVADRAEMHANIGEQRNNWNTLLLTSINTITLTAATMAGVAATGGMGLPLLALKLSSTLLYSAATGMLLVMNKIQPSQLAEEQRNAARLFKQLHAQIQTTLALSTPTHMDVKDAMAKVLALDKAYPLPLIGTMLDKFPETVEPAVWWPRGGKKQQQQQQLISGTTERNGWSEKLEVEMRQIVEVLKRKDTAEYVKLSKLVLKINKILAISGPLLTGIAAAGSAFVGSPSHGSSAVLVGVVAGALASVMNTLEHGGQVGMVFEMYRNCGGFFRLLEESIESTLEEREMERRENGELFEMKVALQLGRSLSELRDLAAASSSSSRDSNATEEFASKLF